MSAQEVHAAVLAAVEEADRVEAAGTGGHWSLDGPWWHPDDELGGLDSTYVLTAREDRKPTAVMPPRDLNWREDTRDHDAALIVASRNAWPASLALVRLVVETHAPEFTPFGPPHCDTCSAAATEWVRWPCRDYRAAAAVVGIEAQS
jgi:hypothetical protein